MSEIGVHKSYCCIKHGCKYGEDETCPVYNGSIRQDFICESCNRDGYHWVEDLLDERKRNSPLEKLKNTFDEIGQRYTVSQTDSTILIYVGRSGTFFEFYKNGSVASLP